MGWWPFGRKRKNSEPLPVLANPPPQPMRQRSAPTLLQLPQPPPDLSKLTPRQSNIHPAFRTTGRPSTPPNPFDDEKELTALPPTPGSLPRQASGNLFETRATPGNRAGGVSFEINREALAARTGIDTSPHLRPVPDSDLNRSASTRSRASNILRRKSTKKYSPNVKREEQLKDIHRSMSTSKRSADVARPQTADNKRPRPSGVSGHRRFQTSVESIQALPEPRPSTMGWGDHAHVAMTAGGVLSPRPTLHYTVSTRQHNAARTGSNLDTLKGKTPVSRLNDSRTIDELADDLDAGALRQLMDRDAKRRERKHREQQERARRRLERYAAREQEPGLSQLQLAELEGPSEPERGRSISRKPHDSIISTEVHGNTIYDPFADPDEVMDAVRSGRSVFPDVPQRSTEYSYSPPPQTQRYPDMIMSPPTSPPQHAKSRSGLSLITNNIGDEMIPGTSQEYIRPSTSESASRKGPLSSLFRRSGKPSPAPPSESSFSNVSRASMATQPIPAHLQERPMSPILTANAPLRSYSRFREDLPEMPLSPPDSRLSSPAVPEPTIVPETASFLPETSPIQESPPIPEADSLETALRPSASLRRRYESPVRRERARSSFDTPVPTSPTTNSESLADVDAEASWLSGRRSNRASARSSVGPTPRSKRAPTFSTSYESIPYVREEVETDDPFRDPEHQKEDRASYEAAQAPPMNDLRAELAAQDDSSAEQSPLATPGAELGSSVTHGSVARTATVIRHGARVKSTEGLLKRLDTSGSSVTQMYPPTTPTRTKRFDYGNDTGNASVESSPTTPIETPWLESAHERHLSTGSARLLVIPARGNSLRNSAHSSQPPSTYLTPTQQSPLPSPELREVAGM